jgi:large subunit ribosomal protein L25
MATVLKAITRVKTGTHSARRFRKQNKIPAIVYGHGEPPVAVALDQRDVKLVVKKAERLLELDIEGKKENVLVKEVQYDAFQQDVIHLDLARVSLDERVTVTVPILLRGTPVGAADGGVITQTVQQAEIECLVTAIPDDVRISVAEMKLGDVMHMKDLPLPAGAKLVGDPEIIVCSCTLVMEEVVAPAEVVVEGEAEPEVIGGKKEAAEAPAEEGAAKKEKEKKEKEKE